MNRLFYPLLFTLLIMACGQGSNTKEGNEAESADATEGANDHAGHAMASSEDETNKSVKSPHTSAMAMVEGAHIHIDYSSPRVRGRVIFGGLVGFDQVWVSGAHRATWIETNKDLIIEGNPLPAGKYGLFTIPGKEEWTVILNTRWDQHGADEYSVEEDVMRFSAKPEIQESKEELTYTVKKTGDNEGSISLEWAEVKLSFDFNVKE